MMHEDRSAQAAQVLTLVAATIPLPPATAAALRLVCRSTKSIVDGDTKELRLSMVGAAGLLAVGNPLTSGLTSLHYERKENEAYSAPGLYNACLIAFTNSSSIQKICMFTDLAEKSPDDEARVALSILGAHEWPRLRSIEIFCIPSIFERCMMPQSTPALTELRLHGRLSPREVVALCHDQGLTARLEVLELGACDSAGHIFEYFERVQALLQSTHSLRHLMVNMHRCVDLKFLAGPRLLSLETLELYEFTYNLYLHPITHDIRPRLRTLILTGSGVIFEIQEDELISKIFTSLPALEQLYIAFQFENWEFMREMRSTTLKSLALEGGEMDDHGVAALGAGLSRLPALEDLKIGPSCTTPGPFLDIYEDEAVPVLLSGPPFAHLRRLETAGNWRDWDQSLEALITASHKTKQLEELVMRNASISPGGFEMLAAAGRRGVWPHFRLFQILEVEDVGEPEDPQMTQEDIDACSRLIQEVWPGLEVKISRSIGDDVNFPSPF